MSLISHLAENANINLIELLEGEEFLLNNHPTIGVALARISVQSPNNEELESLPCVVKAMRDVPASFSENEPSAAAVAKAYEVALKYFDEVNDVVEHDVEDDWELPEISFKPNIRYDSEVKSKSPMLHEIYHLLGIQKYEIPHMGSFEVIFDSNNKAALKFPRMSSDLYEAMVNANETLIASDYNGPLGASFSDIKDFYFRLLKILEALKKCGLAHLDLKPENFLVSHSSRPVGAKLIDWEYAGEIGDQIMRRGTPGYLPPEMLYRALNEITTDMDMFSTGMVLFMVITGTLFFYFDEALVEQEEEPFENYLAYTIVHLGKPSDLIVDYTVDSRLLRALGPLQSHYRRSIYANIGNWADLVENISHEQRKTLSDFVEEKDAELYRIIRMRLNNFEPIWSIEENLKKTIISLWEGDSEEIERYLKFLPSCSVKSFLMKNLLQKCACQEDAEEIVELFIGMTNPTPSLRISPEEALESYLFNIKVNLDFPRGLDDEYFLLISPEGSEETYEYSLASDNTPSSIIIAGGESFDVAIMHLETIEVEQDINEDDRVISQGALRIVEKTLIKKSLSIFEGSTLRINYDEISRGFDLEVTLPSS